MNKIEAEGNMFAGFDCKTGKIDIYQIYVSTNLEKIVDMVD